MSHDFLTSMHSKVFPKGEAKPEGKMHAEGELEIARKGRRGRQAVAKERKHQTIGVSLPPGLHKRAVVRAGEIGVSFSRYMQWCLEAELDGRSLVERFKL